MEYISSDTNVWIDFKTIDRLELPFKLPYIYLMNGESIDDELLNPPGIKSELEALGLRRTELTTKEIYLTETYMARYAKPSVYDCVAMAIAKNRNIVLLTGDGALRKAAHREGIIVRGTIGILDELYHAKLIDAYDYLDCLRKLAMHNGETVRLPKNELDKRISELLNRS